MHKILFILKLLIQERFTGTLHISFFKGGIAKVKKDEEYDLKSIPDLTEAEFTKMYRP